MKHFLKLSVFLIAAALLIMPIAGLTVAAADSGVCTDTISILNPQTNEGNLEKYGYYWNNITETLTIKDLNLKTDSDYGLKIKDGSTVILEGDSTIEASKAALYLSGSVSPRGITFQGKGTLTLISKDGFGLLDASSNKSATVRITSGNLNIRSGGDGINSKYAQIALAGGKLSIEAGNGAYAINAREITINSGCRLTANAPLMSQSVSISSAYLDIASGSPAIQSDSISIIRVDIKAGASRDSLNDAEKYNGENAIVTKTNFFLKTESIIFGEKYTITADIILVMALVVLIAVIIIIPVTIKKKKAKRIISAKQAEEAARVEEQKAKKAAAKKSASKKSYSEAPKDVQENSSSEKDS